MQRPPKIRLFASAFGLIAAAILLTSLRPNPAPVISVPRSSAVHSTGLSLTPLWVDLNHDGLPDSVVLVAEGQRGTIKVELTGVGGRELQCVTSRCFGVVYAADIDHDNNLDLVQESTGGGWPDAIWLGDGKGNFALAAPESSLGVDFYTLPPIPYRPSPSRQPGGTSWVTSTAAQKRERSQIFRLASLAKPTDLAEPQRRRLGQHTQVQVCRELLLWTARMVNAPPVLSSFI